ncbi:putative leucine-rich repeat-containing, plant-type, leucine-rich repeat domain superfamily [Helianthus debilis subsp. tardiflorus]
MSAVFKFSYISSLYLTFCLLLVLALSAKNYDATLCHDDERQALLQFKSGLVDEADRLASWVGETSDCCKWAGLTCDNITGHVHKIHLPGKCDFEFCNTIKECEEAKRQRLRGDISQSILYLKQLEHLDLSCNEFGGLQIPRFMGSLGNLRYLNLSQSSFGGTIPPQLGNLTELEVLCLGSFYDAFESTSIINMQWLSSMRSLRHLDMSGVNLTEASDWFQVINTLPSLAQLHLSRSGLPDIHPNVASLNLTFLSSLDLSGNYFFNSFMPRWIFSITSLVSLDLSGCNLRGPPKSLGNLCNLRHIDMGGNSFQNISLTSLLRSFLDCKSPSLESLHLESSQLSCSLPNQLEQLVNLVHLDLGKNGISGPIPESIGNLSFLRSLNLYGNLISGPIPYSVGGLSSLESLALSPNHLTGTLPEILGQLSKLKYLDLSHNLLTGVVTDVHFSKLIGLKKLYGSGNNLTLRPHHANWVPSFQLESLDISSWDLGPQFPLWLLTQRDLSSAIPECWEKWQSLMFLNLENNNLSGVIPTTMGYLSSLVSLNMCKNKLSGRLPASLMWLNELQILEFASNELVGSIPTWIGTELLDLRILNLRSNSFDGTISHELCYLTAIQILDFAHNNLSGNIPRCFNNFTVLSKKETTEINPDSVFFGFGYGITEIKNSASLVMKGQEYTYSTILGLVMVLDLSGNKLSGNIPVELMALQALQSLK